MEKNKRSWWDRILNSFSPQRAVLQAYEEQNEAFREKIRELEQKLKDALKGGPSEDDNLGPVDLNDIDPDELVFPDSFELILSKIPEGWFVFEAAQSPTSGEWYCHLVEFSSMFPEDDSDEQDLANVRQINSGEQPTLTEAVKECLRKYETGDISEYE